MSIERSEVKTQPVTTRWGRILIVGLLAVVPCGVLAPTPAVAAECATTGEADDADPTVAPWSQLRIRPELAWPLSTGENVTVAVIDSGIDVNHPQLAGQVIGGTDFLGAPGGPSTADCNGHGTQVAGIIAARPVGRALMHGVAPGAKLLSIRQNERNNSETRGGVDTLAQAIREAVRQGAKVINISATTPKDDPALEEAVDFARDSNVVIVAAAGNDEPGDRPDLAAKAVFWPAFYKTVLAVAATDEADKRADFSHSASYVDIAAPGRDVLTTGANGPKSYTTVAGTSFAAPFVSGTAALIRSYYPDLTAAQVVARIIATADVPPQGRGTADLGAGIVNPYAALTAVIPAEGSAARKSPSPSPVALPAMPSPADRTVRNRALAISAVTGGIALLLVIGAVVVPRGRARRWQPRRSTPTAGG